MKGLYPLVFSIVAGSWHGQVISSAKWQDVFSYNNVSHIREDNGKILAVAENGIFTYDTKSGEVSKYLSKVNGLHNVNITAFDYNPENKIGLVGYADGSLDVITNEGVTYIIDAPINTSYKGSKRVNHIAIYHNLAVISADYGVSLFRLEKKEYGETFFSNTPAKESTIMGNVVYSIIGDKILSFDMQNAGLTNFNIANHWTNFKSGNFSNITSKGDILAYSEGNNLMINGNSIPLSNPIKDININEEKIIANTDTSASVYDAIGSLITSQNSNKNLNTSWFSNNTLLAGSKENGLFDFRGFYTPSGPYKNRATRLTLHNDKIWVATGGLNGDFGSVNPQVFTSLGFYFYNGSEWIYPSFFKENASNIYFNILDVAGNPLNYKQTFFANYSREAGQGFYKLEYDDINKDFSLTPRYYDTNYGDVLKPQSADLARNRPSGLAFDEKGNLFVTSSNSNSIKGTNGYVNYGTYLPDRDIFSYRVIEKVNAGTIFRPIIKNNILHIPIPYSPIFALVDLNNSPSNINDDNIQLLDENNGLISGDTGNVISASLDNENQLWIGSRSGLRVTNSISSTNLQNIKAQPIIIEEKGLGEELFRDAMILQIETDASNYKWVSIDEGGVFYLSPNGEKTVYHFTKENSPLPNNSVRDIKIDKTTGKVYFATLEGIVTFQSDVKDTKSNFGEVLVYPNPVIYAQHKGNVRIKGLAERTFIRITDSTGNLVHQAEARGGWYDWDLTHKGKRVASGIYFVLMTNADGTDTTTAKIAVVN